MQNDSQTRVDELAAMPDTDWVELAKQLGMSPQEYKTMLDKAEPFLKKATELSKQTKG